MIRIVIFLCLAISTTAWADLTINSASKPIASGGADRQTTYIKGDQMRIDQISTEMKDGQPVDAINTSMLIRFSGEPAGMIFLDHKAKQATVTSPLEAITAEQTVDAETDPTTSPPNVVKRDETREIMGHTAQGYDFSYSGSLDAGAMGGQQMPPEVAKMMKMKLQVSGTAWVVSGMDGAHELAGFYHRMAEHQMAMGVVDSDQSGPGKEDSMAAPGLTYGLTDAMAQIADKGFPLLTKMTSDVKIEITGPMAKMMKDMMQAPDRGVTSESEVTGISTSNVDAELFYNGGLPEGYTLTSNL